MTLQSREAARQTADLSIAKLIRLAAVIDRVGLQRTAVYGLIKEGRFPRPLKVGGASMWVDVEITHWMEGLVVARDTRN